MNTSLETIGNKPDTALMSGLIDDRKWSELIQHVWRYGDISIADLPGAACSDTESRVSSGFYRMLRSEFFRLKSRLTERYLVKLEPLGNVIRTGVDVVRRFDENGDPNTLQHLSAEINAFVSDARLCVPIRKTAQCRKVNGGTYCFGFSEDTEHRKESFILANGSLKHFLVYFDLLLEHAGDWVISEYVKKLHELEKELRAERGIGIKYIVLPRKRYGPKGTITLRDALLADPQLKDKQLVTCTPPGLPFTTTTYGFSSLSGGKFDGFDANQAVCCVYDLIFSGEGVLEVLRHGEISPELYSCIVLFNDRNFPRERQVAELLAEIKTKSILDYDKLIQLTMERDLSSMEGCAAMPPGSAEVKSISAGDYLEGLHDFASKFGRFDPTVINCACYIGKRLFGIEMPDDFESYGKLFVTSSTLSMYTHVLDLQLDAGAASLTARAKDPSPLGKIGMMMRGFDEDEICLAAVYLILNGDRRSFFPAEIGRAETVIRKMLEDGRRYFGGEADSAL